MLMVLRATTKSNAIGISSNKKAPAIKKKLGFIRILQKKLLNPHGLHAYTNQM